MADSVQKPAARRTRKRRIVSVSLHAEAAVWVDSVVQRLKSVGYRHVSRSEVLNVAVSVLQDTIADHAPYEILKVFLDRAPRS